ncbi:MAG: hypothetical protein F2681_11155 [Actinobacteria bacterium]|nr:hypothetical protein [Actinomycetota bacterium]MSW79147.1 hypothetical protein [Actinomycetota bacterium]MSX56696.1 hypothetical protein [Actinomycetota bacterium]MSX94745.1 hypothetical protein [Actinomycetota bacterium]MSZ83685.1 hypothetical protein [Actinomycetota bacterium]
MTTPIRPHPDGCVVAVRVLPGASAAKLVGMHGDELKIKVCSPPLDGRANAEVEAVLAAACGLRPRDVTLVAGHTSRSKQLVVALSVETTFQRLERWISPLEPDQR